MACSPAKMAANRANAARSTGPKDTSRTRLNALKHGMTASATALPNEDPVEVQRQFDAILDRLDPRDEIEELIARRFVVLSFRLRRCEQFQHAMQSIRVDQARPLHEEERNAFVNDLIGKIRRDPEEICRQLQSTPIGLQCLGQNFLVLEEKLKDGAEYPWHMSDAGNLLDLMGVANGGAGFKRILYLGEAAVGFFGNVPAGLWAGLTDAEKAKAAREELRAIIAGEFARIKKLNEDLDRARFVRDEVGAEDRALFDGSKEAELARKYEAATERGFYRALRELKEYRKSAPEPMPGPEPGPPGPTPESAVPVEPPPSRRGTLASFFRERLAPVSAVETSPGIAPGAEMSGEEGRRGAVGAEFRPARE